MLGLVADIGGTNVRFGLLDLSGHSAGVPLVERLAVESIKHYTVADFPGFGEALECYLNDVDNPALKTGVVAIATPVVGDQLNMTNSHWRISQRKISSDFGFSSLSFVNDFTTLAYALPWLPQSKLFCLGNPVAANPLGAKAVLGPGTGLGVSAVIPTGSDAENWVAFEGEGGHTTLLARNERERIIFEQMSKLVMADESSSHLSAERLLSGGGLELTYRAIQDINGQAQAESSGKVYKTAPEILEHGLAGSDDHAREVLDLFCVRLAQRASDLALTVGATGGVYIGGGILPRMKQFLVESGFRQTFEDKGRLSGFLGNIPTYLIEEPYAALTGAAYVMVQQQASG